ncbi:hypothetical protein CCP3SC5AM1_490016 [Gammaproteobacteria bacterium]
MRLLVISQKLNKNLKNKLSIHTVFGLVIFAWVFVQIEIHAAVVISVIFLIARVGNAMLPLKE